MNPNILPSNRAPLMGIIDPDAYVASTETTAWVALSDFENILATVMAGTLGASATIDAKLEQATDSGGSGAKDITGKLITQLTQAGGDSDKQAEINCRSSELDVAGGFDHVRLSITIAVATSDVGGMIRGFDARQQPAADLTSVDEVVS